MWEVSKISETNNYFLIYLIRSTLFAKAARNQLHIYKFKALNCVFYLLGSTIINVLNLWTNDCVSIYVPLNSYIRIFFIAQYSDFPSLGLLCLCRVFSIYIFFLWITFCSYLISCLLSNTQMALFISFFLSTKVTKRFFIFAGCNFQNRFLPENAVERVGRCRKCFCEHGEVCTIKTKHGSSILYLLDTTSFFF